MKSEHMHVCSHIFNNSYVMFNGSTLWPTLMSYSFIEMMSWLSESNMIACICSERKKIFFTLRHKAIQKLIQEPCSDINRQYYAEKKH